MLNPTRPLVTIAKLSLFAGAGFSLLAGCRSKPTASHEEPAPSASASAPVESAPAPSAEVQAALNPSKDAPYSGPIGTISGVIRVSGDPAAEVPEVKKIPAGRCDDARAFYGKVFREGPGRELADVLVAVTGYNGYLEPSGPAKKVQAKGCAFESRTIALVFGQRLEVQNRGPETFIPLLVGAKQAALIVAMPNGDPVKLFPAKVGEYELADQTHDYAKASVFVLKYPTVTVTKLDGKYELSGIPVGEVDVSALLPATRGTVTQKVKVVAGETTTVDLTIAHTAKQP